MKALNISSYLLINAKVAAKLVLEIPGRSLRSIDRSL